MERKIIITKDGSHSISIPEINITHHSIHGGIRESKHVFIEAGLKSIKPLPAGRCIRIFEMGFGTGLNALFTLIEAEKLQQSIQYSAIELFPLNKEEASTLNYCEKLSRSDIQEVFEQLHHCEWEKDISNANYFSLRKSRTNLLNFSTIKPLNLVYFDAFAPTAQPELWTKEGFEILFNMISPDGIPVTYCFRGDVRRAMQAAGFRIEKIPGPPGKREITRAEKPVN